MARCNAGSWWVLTVVMFGVSAVVRAAVAVESLPVASTGTAPSVSSAEAAAIDTRTNLEKITDPDPMVRRNAAIYLGSEKKKGNVPALKKLLDDENAEVRRAAINALVTIGAPHTVQVFLEKFKSESNLNVKMNIIAALGALKSTAAIPVMTALLNDPYPAFRNEAVRALGKINSGETYNDIVGMLNDEAEGVRVVTADVVGELGLRSAVPLLVKNLKDPVAVVRRACVRALGQVADRAVLSDLDALLQDKDQSVVLATRDAIEKIEAKEQEKQ